MSREPKPEPAGTARPPGRRLWRLPILRSLDRLRRRVNRGLVSVDNLHRLAVADFRARHVREGNRYRDPRHLVHSEAQVFSQGGEDGILREIFRRIGTASRRFAEFGVGNGWENNTVLLLQDGWTGVWLEADGERCRRIRRDFATALDEDRLTLRRSLLDAANVEAELEAAGADGDLDLLSIDVDGNDYWLWQALGGWRPRVVAIEYNAIYPADMRWVMPYDPGHRWRGDTWFGASLKSLEELGRELGYSLVGCTLAGTNAFFVRRDLASEDLFLGPFTAETHHEAPRYFLLGRQGHSAPGRPLPI